VYQAQYLDAKDTWQPFGTGWGSEASAEDQAKSYLNDPRWRQDLEQTTGSLLPGSTTPEQKATREELLKQAKEDPYVFADRYAAALRGGPGAEGATLEDFAAIKPRLAGGRKGGAYSEALQRVKAIGEADHRMNLARQEGDWKGVRDEIARLDAQGEDLTPEQRYYQDALEQAYEHEAATGRKPQAPEDLFGVPPELGGPEEPPPASPAGGKGKKDVTLGFGFGGLQDLYESMRDRVKEWRDLPADQRKKAAISFFQNYFVTNLLSDPKTHIRNAVSNTVHLAMTPITTPFAAMLDRLGGQAGRTVYAGELPHQLRGVYAGMGDALSQFWSIMANGPQALDLVDGVLPESSARGMYEPPGPAKYVTRALDAADKFSQILAYNMDLYGGAYTEARNQAQGSRTRGMSRAERNAWIVNRTAELVANPTEALRENAGKFAVRRVFHEHSAAETAFKALRDIHWTGRFILPFVQTPLAILRQGLRMTPAGFYEPIRGSDEVFGRRLGVQARGEALMGSLGLLGLAWMASQGRLSGNGPSNPSERDRLERQGWKPNSIKIGNTWIGYDTLQPLAFPAAMVANAMEAYGEQTKKNPNTSIFSPDMAQNMAMRAGQAFVDQGTIKSLSDVLRTTHDAGWAKRYAASMLSGLIPFSGALRAVRRAEDPTLRQPQTIREQIQSQLPVVSRAIPPQLRATGEERQVASPLGALGRMLSPADISPTRQLSPTEQKLEDLNITLPVVRGKRTDNPAQDVAERRARAKETMAALDRLFGTIGPALKAFPKEEQRKEVMSEIRGARREKGQEQRDVKEIQDLRKGKLKL